jgi:hypothetical protein
MDINECETAILHLRHELKYTHFRVWFMLIIKQDPTVTVKCRTAIRAEHSFTIICV